MNLRLHPGAQEDFDEGFDWYAERSSDAAVAFAAAVDDWLRRIAASPTRWERIDSRQRRCLVRGFPYSVVYRSDRADIEVIAIAHAARRPRCWGGR